MCLRLQRASSHAPTLHGRGNFAKCWRAGAAEFTWSGDVSLPPSFNLKGGLKAFWHDPLPPELASAFTRDLAAYFWPLLIGGPVFVVITVWVSIAVGSTAALMASGLSGLGTAVAAIACWQAETLEDDATAGQVEDLFRLGSLLSTSGTGTLVMAIMLAHPAEQWQRLVVMLALAVLGLTNGTNIGRPWLLASHALMIVFPLTLGIALSWNGWSGVLAMGGVIAFGLLSTMISRRAYGVQVALLKARAEQGAERRRLAAALDEMPYAIAITDRREQTLVCNRHALNLLGLATHNPALPFADLLLSAPNLLMKDQNRKEFQNYIARMGQKGERFSSTMRMLDSRIIDVDALPMPDGGWVVVMRDTTDERTRLATLVQEARRDPLTGLANRRAFLEELEARCKVAAERPFALVMLDLDGFKAINDRHGHQMGDRVISRVGYRLRALDTQMFVARLGGDEFAIIAEAGSLGAAAAIGNRLIATVDVLSRFGDVDVQVGAAVGVALAPDHGAAMETLMRSADMALLKAKAEPGSQLRMFSPALAQSAEARLDMEARAQAAIRAGQLDVAFQPLLDVASGRVEGWEALVRWPIGQGTPIDSGQLVAIAEARGWTPLLRRLIMPRAMAAVLALPGTPRLWFNLSALDLRQPDLADEIFAMLSAAAFPAQRLALEITETALMRDEQEGLAQLTRLRARGVKVVMDDFGAGFSSLTRLQALPLDAVKISGDLLAGRARDRAAAIVFQAAVRLCRDLGLQVVAEGVETPDDLALARAAGVDLLQGYALARPQSAANMPANTLAAERRLADLLAPA
jgi:diguanylate cyclase (GGDEF)-like protein